MMAQPVAYQLLMRTTTLSSVDAHKQLHPGAPATASTAPTFEIVTPIGRASDIQFATYVDWKNHMRLESKNIYFRQVIGDCYEVGSPTTRSLQDGRGHPRHPGLPLAKPELRHRRHRTDRSCPKKSFATSQFFGHSG